MAGPGELAAALVVLVRSPRAFAARPAGEALLARHGWWLVVARWSLTSVLFLFRDYEQGWRPFVAPPFGLSPGEYGRLQTALALPWGLATSALGATLLWAFCRARRRPVAWRRVLNASGCVQLAWWPAVLALDALALATVGWRLAPVAALHLGVAAWGHVALLLLLARDNGMSAREVAAGAAMSLAAAVGLNALVWR